VVLECLLHSTRSFKKEMCVHVCTVIPLALMLGHVMDDMHGCSKYISSMYVA
jgi:hypothetical protein